MKRHNENDDHAAKRLASNMRRLSLNLDLTGKSNVRVHKKFLRVPSAVIKASAMNSMNNMPKPPPNQELILYKPIPPANGESDEQSGKLDNESLEYPPDQITDDEAMDMD